MGAARAAHGPGRGAAADRTHPNASAATYRGTDQGNGAYTSFTDRRADQSRERAG